MRKGIIFEKLTTLVERDKVSAVKDIYRDFMTMKATESTKPEKENSQPLLVGAAMLRARDLAEQGINGNRLQRLVQNGQVERVGRGLYRAGQAEETEYHTWTQAALLVPQGVICLLSALRFHELTTQAPFEVWLAIGNKAWRPKIVGVPLRIHYFSDASLTSGIEEHQLAGVPVKIYGAAKTVADCFKFRNKIGVDVALEALRAYLRQRLPEKDLWDCAKICRVQKVMIPYLEALQ